MKLDKDACDLIEGISPDAGMNIRFCEVGKVLLGDNVVDELGMEQHFATPYRGQSKPIERMFRTVIELFERQAPTYVGSNTVARHEETKLYWGNFNGAEKKLIEEFPTIEDVREAFAETVRWYNNCWEHGGQGMNNKTPAVVFAENGVERRDIPAELMPYIFARREIRTVGRHGVNVEGIDYINKDGKLSQYIGQEVEVRLNIDNIGNATIFSLPDRLPLCEAESELLKDRGIPEENNRARAKIQKAEREQLKEYKELKKRFEGSEKVKTPAEIYAAEHPAEAALKVVGGEPLAPASAAVKPKKSKYSFYESDRKANS
jgi:hypothetical protein